MPVILFLVVWGLLETIEIFSPIIALRSVDFQTFALPTMDIYAVLIFLRPFICEVPFLP